MKASSKAPAASVSTAATSKAKETAKEVVTVAVPAEVKQLVTSTASASVAALNAVTTQEQTIIKLGETVNSTMGKHPYETTRLSLKPIMEAAYKAANAKASRPKEDAALLLYVGQQMSRIMAIAYPGGKEATASQRKQAQAEFAKGKALGLGTVNLISLAGGKAKLAKSPEDPNKTIIVPVKQDNRGGHNAKAPIDAMKDTLSNALTAAKTASIDREQMLTVLSDILIALELMDAETESLDIVVSE